MKSCKLIVLLLVCFNVLSSQEILYELSMPKPSNHLFEVNLKIENIPYSADGYIDFILPVWRSGRYVIFNFPSGVQEFSALNGSGNILKWKKTDKATWRVQNGTDNDVIISYKVFANEFGSRTRGLNDDLALIDASAVFMYADKFRHNNLTLKIEPYNDWHVTTGLAKTPDKNIFTAQDYDYLADCPILVGNQSDVEFTAEGKKHTASFTGIVNYDTGIIIDDLKKLIGVNSNFWGGLPYDEYVFMFLFISNDFGGTEHINSCIIYVPQFHLIDTNNYYDFIAVCSHEFFHTWNVKRLRPKGITPYDFTKENYTEELWIAEGTTSYYEHILLLKSGLDSAHSFLTGIEKSVLRYMTRPGNNIQTLAESSFDAWIKFWANSPNKWISESDYYAKGAILSMLIDLEIRNSSQNKYSLDNIMRAMLERFPLEKGGYTNKDFIGVCNEFAGKDLQSMFDKYLYSADSIDWNKYLNYAGIKLKTEIKEEKATLGVTVYDAGNNLKISYINPGSPAYDAGLDAGDEIIALNGFKLNSDQFNNIIGSLANGNTVKLTILRNKMLHEFEIAVKIYPEYEYKIEKIKNPADLQVSIYNSWLNSDWYKDFGE